MASFVLTSPFK